jgi:hypothetical protein
MRPRQLLPFLPLALAVFFGCSSNNKGKIEGTNWSSKVVTVKGKTAPAGMMKLEFRQDGTLTVTGPTGAYTGTYSLGFGDAVTFKLDRELSGSKTHAEKIAINGDELTLTDSDGTRIPFERAK